MRSIYPTLTLILVSGVKHGLIVVESRLIEEMLKEIGQLPIAADQVKVIESAADLGDLRRSGEGNRIGGGPW